jgi:hypothetical protein
MPSGSSAERARVHPQSFSGSSAVVLGFNGARADLTHFAQDTVGFIGKMGLGFIRSFGDRSSRHHMSADQARRSPPVGELNRENMSATFIRRNARRRSARQ